MTERTTQPAIASIDSSENLEAHVSLFNDLAEEEPVDEFHAVHTAGRNV